MAKGYSGGIPGNFNMNNLMKQADKMRRQMEEVQNGLAEKTIETTSGGGAIKVIITGKKVIKEITISPDVVDPDDVEMLQDLVLTAVNEAVRQADELSERELGKVTGGMNLPGGLF